MITAQLAARRREYDGQVAEVNAILADPVQLKSYRGGEGALERRVNELAEYRDQLEREEKNAAASGNLMQRMGGFEAATLADQPVTFAAKSQTGREVNPLAFSEHALESVFKAATSRQSVSTKAFSTVEGLLPAQLDPNILGKVHESRLLDRLPVTAISAPSYEIIVHNSTTGAPAVTAEGAAKPEVVLNMTSQTLTAVKIAAHVGISYESLSDFPQFRSYAETELSQLLTDVENAELLSGSGTGGHMTGFLSTSGILTHDASTDTGTGVTVIDSLEKSIAQLRVGAALATADLLVLHPQTWSAIRRLKDTTGRFLFISADSDPSNAQANSIFGIPVLVTTAQAAGTGLMLDTTKFGRVLVREGITLHTGQNSDDFSKNVSRFILEERLVLAVERPAAVLAISNLPTA